MKTLQVSKFKAQCLSLLKEVRTTGEPLTVTLRGRILAVVQAPGGIVRNEEWGVAETLQQLRPLLVAEDTDLEVPRRRSARPSARDPFGKDL